MSELKQAHVRQLYRPVIIVFLVFVVLTIISVVYTGWSSTTITITPKQKTISTSFSITIAPTTSTTDDHQLAGTFTTTQQTATVTAAPKTTGTPVPAHATGTVTIKNTTAKTQPLATGTRLRSDSGIIVRTDKRVDVAGGSSVDVTVTADPLGETGNVPAGKFVIVALWPGLQDKIYGQSATALAGGMSVGNGTLSLDDLTAASSKAADQIRKKVGDNTPGTYVILTPASVVSAPKPEVPSTSYQVTVTENVSTITYSADRLQDLIHIELQRQLADGQQLDSVAMPSLSMPNAPTATQANISVEATGTASLSSSAALLSPTSFVSMTASTIQTKLTGTDDIKSVVIHLSPWWRTTTSDQVDRITVLLAKPKS